jgi:tetratricopeptide (TPR) repeat protein/tRNA A-37 threonylcarbamoyl transferase component Bud32
VLRSDDLLLAVLVKKRYPALTKAVRALLEQPESEDGQPRSSLGQRLIRAKHLAPAEFIALSAQIQGARRRCPGCQRQLVVLPRQRERRPRCARCGTRSAVPGPPPGQAPNTPQATPRAGGKRGDTAPDSATFRGTVTSRIGPYAIEGVIAQGGMGVVYRAFDATAKRRVALKVLRGDASEDMAARFRREAESIARLRHPAIVCVHDSGIDRGARWFTMDLIEGEDLEKALETKKLSREKFIALAADVADGLEHAHERGIIHRDVKPQNVLFEHATRTAKLTDFGLAHDLARSRLTEDGELIGTPLYMAPEQLEGHEIDRRTDVYALGVMLYRGLAGTLPFEAQTLLDLKQKVLHVVPEPPSLHRPDLPSALDRICLKALEKHPDDRYETAGALAKDLRTWLAGGTVLAERVAGPVRAWRWLVRRPVAAAAAVGLTVGLLVAAGVIESRIREKDRLIKIEADERVALDKVDGAITRAAQAQEQGRLALARGDARAARPRFEQALEAVAAGRAALPATNAQVRKDAEARLKAADRSARRGRVEAGTSGNAEARRAAREETAVLLADDGRDPDVLFLLGRLELDAGRLGPAIDALGRAIDADASRLDAYYLRGEAHRRAGRAAFASLDLAKALGEGAPPGASLRAFGREAVLVARARSRLSEKDPESAARDLDEAARLAPHDADIHAARAELALFLGDQDAALRELDLACTIEPDRGELRRERGELRASVGDRDRALEDLDAALKSDPRDRVAATARARLRSLALDDAGAEEDLKVALASEESPDSPALRAAQLVLARLRRVQGRTDEALAALERALAKADALGAAEVAPFRLERAEILVARRRGDDLRDAAREADVVLAGVPGSTRALRVAARAALALDDHRTARARAERALELDPRDGIARTLRFLAMVKAASPEALVEGGRAAMAQRAQLSLGSGAAGTSSLLTVGPPEEEAIELCELGQRTLARARSQALRTPGSKGRDPAAIERARRAFARAAGLAPELAPVRLGVAEALEAAGSLDDALRELERALGETPPLVEELALRARILLAKDERPKAIEAYGAALDAAPDDNAHVALRATLNLERGRARLESGDPAGALQDLDRACTLDPLAAEAFRSRARARDILGDRAGCESDRARLALLETGYRAKVEAMFRDAFMQRSDGEHGRAAKTLSDALDCIPRSDARMRATFYYHRAQNRVRSMDVPEAFLDLGAMVELDPTRLADLWDEIMAMNDTFSLDAIFDTAVKRATDREPDPDFFLGFGALVRLEVAKEARDADARGKIAREGVLALGRYLDRVPLNVPGLAIRSMLRIPAGDLPGALADARASLELSTSPGAAELALFRVSLAERDKDAALAHLEAALKVHFFAWRAFEHDLAGVEDPRFARAIALARGRDSLEVLRLVEKAVVNQVGWERTNNLTEGMNAGSAGIAALAVAVKASDPEACRLVFKLRLARGRCGAQLGTPADLARDLMGAIESAPGRLAAEWGDVLRAVRTLAKNADGWEGKLNPIVGETEPGPLYQRLAKDLVVALTGGSSTARRPALEASTDPGAIALRSILKLAANDARGALADAKEPKLQAAAPAVAALLAARAESSLGHRDEALRLLKLAVAAGVRVADLKEDTLLQGLRDDPEIRDLGARAGQQD